MYGRLLWHLSGEEVVENAKEASQTIRDKRANAYKSKLAEVSQNKEPIDLTPFKESVTEDLKKFVRYNEGETITTPPQKAFTAIPEKYPHSGQYTVKSGQYTVKSGQYTVKIGEGKYLNDDTGTPQFFTKDNASKLAERLNTESAKKATQTAKTTTTPGTFDWERTTVGAMKKTKKGLTGTGAVSDLHDMYNMIMKWGNKPKDATPMGLDMLKRNLDQFYSDKSDVRAFTASARNKVKNLIVENVPEYSEMTKGYSQATELIKDIESNLMMRKQGMSGRITADSTLRRLTSSMREGFEMRRDLVDALSSEGKQDIASQVAGLSMSTAVPHGLFGKIGSGGLMALHPKMWPVIAAASPRIVGEFMKAFGQAEKETRTSRELMAKLAQSVGKPTIALPSLLLANRNAQGNQ